MMRQIVPMFTWAQDHATYAARAARLNAGDIAIVTSSNNGPTPYDPVLRGHVRDLDERGVLVFGYVPAGYGSRPFGDVLDDITAWRRSYDVRRVFFDEWAGNRDLVGLCWGMIRGYGGSGTTDRPILVVNPGVPGITGTVPPGTLVVTHESAQRPNTAAPHPWEAAIVHSTLFPADTRRYLAAHGWRWGFVTSDGADGNSYDEVGDDGPP